jgi:hypothetical protein
MTNDKMPETSLPRCALERPQEGGFIITPENNTDFHASGMDTLFLCVSPENRKAMGLIPGFSHCSIMMNPAAPEEAPSLWINDQQ